MTLPPEPIVLQRNGGRFVSELIGGRFQVMASTIGATFYVADLSKTNDPLMRFGGDRLDFTSEAEARAFIEAFTNLEKPINQGSNTMARKHDLTTLALKAISGARKTTKDPAPMDAVMPKKVGKKLAELRAEVETKTGPAVVVPMKPKAEKPVKPKAADIAKPASTEEYKNLASMFKALVLEGKLTDKAIYEAVATHFNCKPAANSVSNYRKVLREKGINAPDRVKG